jgi:mannose-6-phosphate isomerase-like protein (cupin superfamily)
MDERPWGRFERLTLNTTSTVKCITVDPGHRLSLQRHEQRDEWWTVLDMPLDVEIGGESWTALPGERIWIPRGTAHRVANAGSTPGRFLEVAFGHFDEDDIERIHDDYTR